MEFKDKYSMNQNTMIGFANLKNLAILQSVLASEGIEMNNNVLNSILQGKCVADLEMKDAMLAWNLRETMKYIKETGPSDDSVEMLKTVHTCLCKGVIDFMDLGVMRTNEQNVDVKWNLPSPLSEEEINERFTELRSIECATEKAMKIAILIMEYQVFPFGSNMIAQLVANYVLIKNCAGLFIIPSNKMEEFFNLVSGHLENGGDALYNFIYDNCIQGV